MAEDDQYLLGYRQAEQERLLQQAQQLAPESEWLFDRIGIGAGDRVVEIGCGPEGCLGLLSTRVGDRGRVIGVERSPDAVALACSMVKERSLTNFRHGNRSSRSCQRPRAGGDTR